MEAVELLAEVDCARVLALARAGVSPSLPWMSYLIEIKPNVWKSTTLSNFCQKEMAAQI
jgi:hypothetical protein